MSCFSTISRVFEDFKLKNVFTSHHKHCESTSHMHIMKSWLGILIPWWNYFFFFVPGQYSKLTGMVFIGTLGHGVITALLMHRTVGSNQHNFRTPLFRTTCYISRIYMSASMYSFAYTILSTRHIIQEVGKTLRREQ